MNKNQTGAIGTALAVALGFIAIIGAAVAFFVINWISAANYAGPMEEQIIAAYDQNRNVLSSYYTSIQTQVQVPEMARDDLIKVIEASTKGTFGPDGSKQVFLAVQKVIPEVPQDLYKQIQRIDEAKRNEFQLSQTVLIEKRRSYKSEMSLVVRGFFIKLAGFPKIDLNKYDIVTDAKTERAFETKQQEVMQLRAPTAPAPK
jgi:hypothetical protein